MSKYERYLIYPLLIMALAYGFFFNAGISARQETEHFDTIVANSITVESEDGTIKIEDGSILIMNPNANTYGVFFSEGMGFREGPRGYTLSPSGFTLRNHQGLKVLEAVVDGDGYGRLSFYDKDGEEGLTLDYRDVVTE